MNGATGAAGWGRGRGHPTPKGMGNVTHRYLILALDLERACLPSLLSFESEFCILELTAIWGMGGTSVSICRCKNIWGFGAVNSMRLDHTSLS